MNDSSFLNIKADYPVVSIVGRANVGKSTLFNRLIKKRRSITDPTPGVTRDLIEEPMVLGDRLVTLIDTGGVSLDEEGFHPLVTEKSRGVLERSDAVILLLDVHEITPEDETLIEWIRPYADKLLVGVNKVDHENHERLLGEIYAYGFSRVIPISAEHGRGIRKLTDTLKTLIDFSAYEGAVAEDDQAAGISVMGKPNTGKSTLVNRLLGEDASIISEIPGTTRDVVSGAFTYRGKRYQVFDTAGIRRRGKVDEHVEYYSVNRAIKTIDYCDVVMLLIDAAEGLSEQDKKIASLITRKGKGLILVLNKWDLMSGTPNQLRAVKDRIRFLFPIVSFAPVIPVSAKKGEGIDALLKTADRVYAQLHKRVETSALNDALQRWMEAHELPRDRKGRFKIFYATQVQANPVEFVLFVNRKEKFPRDYLGYITNGIRRELGFDLVPLSLTLRERKRKE